MMTDEIVDQSTGASWSQDTEPDFGQLFSASDRLTCLELWNFEVGQ